MTNKKITTMTSDDVWNFLKLDVDKFSNLSQEELNEISNNLKKVNKNVDDETLKRINFLTKAIQQELYKRLKIGEYAFSTSKRTGEKVVSVDYLFYKTRMKQIARTREIEILENWLEEKAELQTFFACYSSSKGNFQIKIYYFTFENVLNKINGSYSKKDISKPLFEIPLLFNQKDAMDLLNIPRARFERSNLKELIGYYSLKISKKMSVMYSFNDLFEFANFWNFYKQHYIDGDSIKRSSVPVNEYYEKFQKFTLKEKDKYRISFESFYDKAKNL